MLKSLSMDGPFPRKKLSFDGEYSLPSLEELSLEFLAASAKDLVRFMSGLGSLRNLTVIYVDNFFDLKVLRVLPQSLERLEFNGTDFGFDDQLDAICNLPRLNDLGISSERKTSWPKLLPAAPRLEHFKVAFCGEENYGDFCTLLVSMKCLKSLDLSIGNGDSWDDVLQAISTLELLENLKLHWIHCTIEPSKKGLLHLANGPVRLSLVNCEIKAQLLTRYENNGELRESLIRSFKQEVEPWFEKRHGGAWKFTLLD